ATAPKKRIAISTAITRLITPRHVHRSVRAQCQITAHSRTNASAMSGLPGAFATALSLPRESVGSSAVRPSTRRSARRGQGLGLQPAEPALGQLLEFLALRVVQPREVEATLALHARSGGRARHRPAGPETYRRGKGVVAHGALFQQYGAEGDHALPF